MPVLHELNAVVERASAHFRLKKQAFCPTPPILHVVVELTRKPVPS